MAKARLASTLLGREVVPQPWLLNPNTSEHWFGVHERSSNADCAAEQAKKYVPVPDALVVASDRGRLVIEPVRLDGAELLPGTIVAAWTEDGAVKVSVGAHTGDVREFYLANLKLVPKAVAPSTPSASEA